MKDGVLLAQGECGSGGRLSTHIVTHFISTRPDRGLRTQFSLITATILYAPVVPLVALLVEFSACSVRRGALRASIVPYVTFTHWGTSPPLMLSMYSSACCSLLAGLTPRLLYECVNMLP